MVVSTLRFEPRFPGEPGFPTDWNMLNLFSACGRVLSQGNGWPVLAWIELPNQFKLIDLQLVCWHEVTIDLRFLDNVLEWT